MKEKSEISRQVLVLILSLILSILIAFLPNWTKYNFTKADEITLGVLLFIVFLLLDIFVLSTKISAREAREQQLWTACEDCDAELHSIRNCFIQIVRESYGTKDLFVSHFKNELHQLSLKIREVAERRQLTVQADHFLNVENVLDAFQGDKERIWRYTWAIDGDYKLFDDLPWRRYFEKTAKMVEENDIKEARALLVLDDIQWLTSARVEKLLDFFHTNRGFQCSIVKREDFRSICADSELGKHIDFGIYGSRLLFLTEQYEPEIRGQFTKDSTRIQSAIKSFDSMWESASVARRNPSTASQRVTIEELFEFDGRELA